MRTLVVILEEVAFELNFVTIDNLQRVSVFDCYTAISLELLFAFIGSIVSHIPNLVVVGQAEGLGIDHKAFNDELSLGSGS